MKTQRIIAILAAALAASVLAGCAGAGPGYGGGAASSSQTPSSSTSVGAADLSTASTSLGTIVVDGIGMTVYFYDRDVKGERASVCTGACANAWPPVTTTSATPTVHGVTGTVGTIPAASGKQQITIDGLPVYTYAGDGAPGDVSGQGAQGIWWVVAPNGTEMKSASNGGGSW